LEAIEERSKQTFSVIDVQHAKLFKKVANYPHFLQQLPRGENFLKAELVKVEEANKQQRA
jgi:alpha-acetolactate decarboxylase